MMSMMNFQIKGPTLGTANVCAPILRALPQWFGIEEAIVHYVGAIAQLPTLLAYQAHTVVGFLTIKIHNPYAAEVYVMGIRQEAHRQGIGKALVQQAEAFLRGQKVEYLQVKTLSPAHPDVNYAKTRAFYLAVGFRPLEELPELWGEQNPCLLLIKRL